MKNPKLRARSLLLTLTALLVSTLSSTTLAKKPRLKADDLLAYHLKSIGSETARSARKNNYLEGPGQLRIRIGGGRFLKGNAIFCSEGNKFLTSLLFHDSNYPGEEISFDGRETYVKQLNPGARSEIGQFLYVYKNLLEEGLIGGSLSTAWPLLHLKSRRAKIKYRGLRKTGAGRLHELEYRMRRPISRMKVKLYFNPETYQHVATLYVLTVPESLPSMGPSPRDSSPTIRANSSPQQYRKRFVLEEGFADFKTFDGVTTPTRWRMRLTTDTAGNKDRIIEWEINYRKVRNNQSIDPATFVLY